VLDHVFRFIRGNAVFGDVLDVLRVQMKFAKVI
jgi:hypothetical protein